MESEEKRIEFLIAAEEFLLDISRFAEKGIRASNEVISCVYQNLKDKYIQ